VFALRQRISLLTVYIEINNNYSDVLAFIPNEEKYEAFGFNFMVGYAKFYNSFGQPLGMYVHGDAIRIETDIAEISMLRPVKYNDSLLLSDEQVDKVWLPKDGTLALNAIKDYQEFERNWINDRIGYEKEILQTQPMPLGQLVLLNLSDLTHYVYRLQWKIHILKKQDIFFFESPNLVGKLEVKGKGFFMGENVVEILLDDRIQRIQQTIFVKGRERLPIAEIKIFVSSIEYSNPTLWPDEIKLQEIDETGDKRTGNNPNEK
jgi:hypothetical protein